MTIKKNWDSATVILSIAGRLDTITSSQLKSELESIFAKGAYNLTLDLKELDYISSAGVGAFLDAYQKVTSLSKKLKITGANDSVKEILTMTGLTRVIDISS